MQKKKIIFLVLFSFVFGYFICILVHHRLIVEALTSISSSVVSYDKESGDSIDVKSALDELYSSQSEYDDVLDEVEIEKVANGTITVVLKGTTNIWAGDYTNKSSTATITITATVENNVVTSSKITSSGTSVSTKSVSTGANGSGGLSVSVDSVTWTPTYQYPEKLHASKLNGTIAFNITGRLHMWAGDYTDGYGNVTIAGTGNMVRGTFTSKSLSSGGGSVNTSQVVASVTASVSTTDLKLNSFTWTPQ